MSNQGYQFEGTDHRLLGGIFARITSALTFASKYQPPSLILSFLGFRLYLPLWWKKRSDFPQLHKFLMLRMGYHYDKNNVAYVFGFALKVVDDTSI